MLDAAAKGGIVWLFYALFIVIGLVFVGIAVLKAQGARRFLSTAIEAEGQIVDYTQKQNFDDERLMYSAVFEFTTADGQVTRVTANTSSSSKPAVGRQVRVLYDPQDPQRARLKSWAALWMLPTVFGALGAMLILLGVGVWTGTRPRPTRGPAA